MKNPGGNLGKSNKTIRMEDENKVTKKSFRINGFKQQTLFFEMIKDNPDVHHTEIALYWYLLHVNNKLSWCEWFGLSLTEALTGSKMCEKTFRKAISALEKYGFIKLRKGARNKASMISIVNLLQVNFTYDVPHHVPTNVPHHVPHHVPTNVPSFNNGAFDLETSNENTVVVTTDTVESAPIKDDVINFFQENGYSVQAAEKFYDGYSLNDWKDPQNRKIHNWRQKASDKWFKPDNVCPAIERKKKRELELREINDKNVEELKKEAASLRERYPELNKEFEIPESQYSPFVSGFCEKHLGYLTQNKRSFYIVVFMQHFRQYLESRFPKRQEMKNDNRKE